MVIYYAAVETARFELRRVRTENIMGKSRVMGSIPGLGRSPGEGNGNSFQYSGLKNSMDRRAWQATVHGVAKSQT